MRRIASLGLAIFVFLGAVPSAQAADYYSMSSIVLLQPEAVIRERVPEGAEAIAAYIKAINAAINDRLSKENAPSPVGLAIFVAVRPGGASNAWIGSNSFVAKPLSDEVVAAVKSVPA